jgi:hypothetical protein
MNDWCPRTSRVPDVTAVEVVGPYGLRLTFDDGTTGDIDVSKRVEFRGVFAPLADPAHFALVHVDGEAGTVAWPGGADLDPVVLHGIVTGRPRTMQSSRGKS